MHIWGMLLEDLLEQESYFDGLALIIRALSISQQRFHIYLGVAVHSSV